MCHKANNRMSNLTNGADIKVRLATVVLGEAAGREYSKQCVLLSVDCWGHQAVGHADGCQSLSHLSRPHLVGKYK